MSFICSNHNRPMKNRFLHHLSIRVFRRTRLLNPTDVPSGEKSHDSGEIRRIVPLIRFIFGLQCFIVQLIYRIVSLSCFNFTPSCSIVPPIGSRLGQQYLSITPNQAVFMPNEITPMRNTNTFNVIYPIVFIQKTTTNGTIQSNQRFFFRTVLRS